MTAQSELKPCPFCGGVPTCEKSGGWYMKCENCETTFGYAPPSGGIYSSEEAAIEAWNGERITRRDERAIHDEAGEEIGQAVLTEFGEGRVYVSDFEVSEGHRSRGYGTKFLEGLRSEYAQVYLAPETPRARGLYERLGARVSIEGAPKFLRGCVKKYGVLYVLTPPEEGK